MWLGKGSWDKESFSEWYSCTMKRVKLILRVQITKVRNLEGAQRKANLESIYKEIYFQRFRGLDVNTMASTQADEGLASSTVYPPANLAGVQPTGANTTPNQNQIPNTLIH